MRLIRLRHCRCRHTTRRHATPYYTLPRTMLLSLPSAPAAVVDMMPRHAAASPAFTRRCRLVAATTILFMLTLDATPCHATLRHSIIFSVAAAADAVLLRHAAPCLRYAAYTDAMPQLLRCRFCVGVFAILLALMAPRFFRQRRVAETARAEYMPSAFIYYAAAPPRYLLLPLARMLIITPVAAFARHIRRCRRFIAAISLSCRHLSFNYYAFI